MFLTRIKDRGNMNHLITFLIVMSMNVIWCMHDIGEMLIGPARALLMDEISNCLDSSTTFKIIVYQGPRVHMLEYFEYMGFRCPERKAIANFLQEVTLRKDQKQCWAWESRPYKFVIAKEFTAAFQSFHVG